MKIFSWNVNGIRAVINKGEFAKFIAEYQPDVLCLQETKAKQGQAEIDLPEYEELWNSADRAGYSGTAIFTKIKPLSVSFDGNLSSLRAQRSNPADNTGLPRAASGARNDTSGLTDRYGDLTREGRVIAAEFDRFWLVSVYTPNSKDDLSRLEIRQRWDKAFLEMLSKLQQSKPVIVCGDLNVAHREIDVSNPKTKVGKHGFTLEERAGFQNYLDAGFRDIFRDIHGDIPDQYTWWSYLMHSRERNIGWRIDYFLAGSELAKNITAAEIYPSQLGSDHCPISITLEDK
jgi:exodeoxyribonuclease-3